MRVFNVLFIIVSLFFLINYILVLKNPLVQTNLLEISSGKRNALLLFAAAIFVISRLYHFGLIPGGINQDEAMSAVDGYYLANYGIDHLGSPFPVHMAAWEYGQQSALLSYSIAACIKIFGFSIFSVRLPSLIFSFAGALCFTLYVKDVFDDNFLVIVAAFLIAVNPWHFVQSRWSLDCNLFPHVVIIGIFFLNRSMMQSQNRNFLIAISMFFFGLSMYTYGIAIYTIPFFLLITCISLLVKRQISVLSSLIAIASYSLIAWPFIACMAINAFNLDSFSFLCFTVPYFPLSIRSNDILFFSSNIPRMVARNVIYFVRAALLQIDGPYYQPWNEVDGFGTIYLFSLPFVLAGIISTVKSIHRIRHNSIVILACFIATCLFCGIVTNCVNINRINIIYYPIIMLCAVGIASILSCIPFSRKIIPLVYLISACLFFHTYFNSYSQSISGEFKKDLGDAICNIMDNTSHNILVVCSDKNSDLPSSTEIICMFYELEYTSNSKYSGDIIYKDLEKSDISRDMAYVVPLLYISNFDSENYEISRFGNYYSIIPLNSNCQ